MTSVSIGPR
jgi:hypothetical protein